MAQPIAHRDAPAHNQVMKLASTLLPFALSSALFVGAFVACGSDDESSGASSKGPPDAQVQQDAPSDHVGEAGSEAAEVEPGSLDSDGDGVPDSDDICPGFDDAIDTDGDGIPDGCDHCPHGDDRLDADGDGIADECDICPGLDDQMKSEANGTADCRNVIKLWLRADRGVFTDDGSGASGTQAKDGERVRLWEDQGEAKNHAQQAISNRQPVFMASALPNGGSAIKFEGVHTPNDGWSNDLEGPLSLTNRAGKSVFVVARASHANPTLLFELNRLATVAGSTFQLTTRIGVDVQNGFAWFSDQPLGRRFHIIAVQHPNQASTSDIRAWYDGIPIDASNVQPCDIDTGSGGYRVGGGHALAEAGFSGDIAELLVYEHVLTPKQREAVGFTLERKHGLKTWYVEQNSPVSVYLLAGQSNMVGQGYGGELSEPLNDPQGDVMFWWGNHSGWSPLRTGSGNGPDQFGPELNYGRLMADAKPGSRLVLIKHAVNGTSLAQDWNPSSGPIYAGFMKTLSEARARLEGLGIEYVIRGMLWMQGESDAMQEAMAASYLNNFLDFATAVRTATGVANLPIVMARIRATMPAPFPYALQVRMAQETAATMDPNVHVIDTDSLTFHGDDVHYDTAGQLELGARFAQAMLTYAPP